MNSIHVMEKETAYGLCITDYFGRHTVSTNAQNNTSQSTLQSLSHYHNVNYLHLYEIKHTRYHDIENIENTINAICSSGLVCEKQQRQADCIRPEQCVQHHGKKRQHQSETACQYPCTQNE